eukprot:403347692
MQGMISPQQQLGLTICVIVWMWYYNANLDIVQLEGSYGGSLTRNQVFVLSVIEDISDGVFRFDMLLAVHCGFLWLKVTMLLKLTRSFGPLIKIVINMMQDILEFFVIWSINLVFFSCVGMLLFGELDQYNSIYDTLVMFIQSALGAWDLTIYDNILIGKEFGQVYHLIFIIFNTVLLINLIIAILATTFSILNDKKLALYYDGIIEAIPTYKYDKLYGSIICAFPPFNMITLPFSFAFLQLKNIKIIKSLNLLLLHFAYSPVYLLTLLSFAIGNIILMPICYIYTVSMKVQILFTDREHILRSLLSATSCVLLGIPMILVTQFTDLYYFTVHSYSSNCDKLMTSVKPKISQRSILILYKIAKSCYKQDIKSIENKQIIKKVREDLQIHEDLHCLIYGVNSNNSTQYNIAKEQEPLDTKSHSRERYLKNIQVFNCIKRVIKNCSNNSNQLVDIQLLYYLTKEVKISLNITLQNLNKDLAKSIPSPHQINQKPLKIMAKNSHNIENQGFILKYQKERKNIKLEFAFSNPRRVLQSLEDKPLKLLQENNVRRIKLILKLHILVFTERSIDRDQGYETIAKLNKWIIVQ